ncbi:hypothetical protein BD560DRAFT_409950 [Blakeslea trispora]|nr:hypothetical protein BD560DRAFT_409950 [Blakeslea trispora]
MTRNKADCISSKSFLNLISSTRYVIWLMKAFVCNTITNPLVSRRAIVLLRFFYAVLRFYAFFFTLYILALFHRIQKKKSREAEREAT